ncbi:MAG TPA: hypothetical protein VE174_04290 [Actinomycetota bacterium]|nr:hypothetical protein [Actinomycetota bacterium]
MRWVITATALLLLGPLATGNAATPEQLAATDQPVVEGAVSQHDMKCDRKQQLDGKEVAAVAKRCLRFFRFDTGAESDPERDYGVLWLQSTVDGRNGWCAQQVASKIILAPGLGLHNHRPGETTNISRRKEVTTDLAADANGNGQPARVSQRWVAYPRVFDALLNKNHTAFTLNWRGDTGKKLGFASGIEISWPADAPPEGISFRLNFKLAEC